MWKWVLGGYAAIGVGFVLHDLSRQKDTLASLQANQLAQGRHDAVFAPPKAKLFLTVGWLPLVVLGAFSGEL